MNIWEAFLLAAAFTLVCAGYVGKKVIKIRTKKISFVYKKLKPNKKYYVKARFYRIIKGKKVYGKWGKAKKVTFK